MWMLYDEFIYVLRDLFHRWPWHIDIDKQIRTLAIEGREHCPITAACATLHQRAFDPESYRGASALLGLDRHAADVVAQAADLAGGYNAHVRADLVHALRLDEMWGLEGRWNDPAFHAHPYPHGYDRPMAHGGISPITVSPVTSKASSRCITPRPIVRSPSPHTTIIDETAAVRSIMSAWSADSTESPSPPLANTGPRGSARSSKPKRRA